MLPSCTNGKASADALSVQNTSKLSLPSNADHHARFLFLHQLREQTATQFADLYRANERKYEDRIMKLLQMKRIVGDELIKRAIERTTAIGDQMIGVIHDFYSQRLQESEQEIDQLKLVSGGIWDLLSKMKGGSDPLFKELIDGFLSSEIETERPTPVQEPATNSILDDINIDRHRSPAIQQTEPSQREDTDRNSPVRPADGGDSCPNVDALLRQLNGTSSQTDNSPSSLIENEPSQPMTLGEIPSFGTVFAPKVDLTSAIDTVTMSTNHVQPPPLQTTSSPFSTTLPQPMIPSIAGARAMSSFAITPEPNDKSSPSPHTDKLPILGLGTLFNGGSLRGTPNCNGSLRPSNYNKNKSQTAKISNRPTSKVLRNGDINIMSSGHFRKQRSRKRKRNDDDALHSDHEITSRKRIKLEDYSAQTVDALLQRAMTLKPDLKWHHKDEWCRYCGARGSSAFFDSVWGPKTLCNQHYSRWKLGKLDLTATHEPTDPDHAINRVECTERQYLIEVIHSYRTTSEEVSESEEETTASDSDSFNSDGAEDDDYTDGDESEMSDESNPFLDEQEVDPFECFVVAANCKLCSEKFDDFGKYKRHIQQHYNEDDEKEWKVCSEPGCDPTKRWKYSHFVTHLIGLHGWDRPFWCSMKKHGVQCSYSASHKSNMIQHLRSVHDLQISNEDATKFRRKAPTPKVTRSMSSNLSKKETPPRRKRKVPEEVFVVDDDVDTGDDNGTEPKKNAKNGRAPSALDQYRGIYYTESCNCKLCGAHFDNFSLYKHHLKKHFDEDPNKKWKQCFEPGCDPKKTYSCPIPHLCGSHDYEYPYHCKLNSAWNEPCHFRASGKQNMMRHLKKVHNKEFPTNSVAQSVQRKTNQNGALKKKPSLHDPDGHLRSMYVESADCKLCNAHFNNFQLYQAHVRGHFEADPKLKWKRCFEKGCDPSKYYNGFIPHLCGLHGWDHPFKCNQMVNGQPCTYRCSVRQNMVYHLKSMHRSEVAMNGPKAENGGARIRSAELDQYRDRYYKESADCLLCGQHFDDFDCYKAHLKQHFTEDPNRTWGRCSEKGCDPSKRIACFMSHLCVNHGYDRAFHCTMTAEGGGPCKFNGPIRYRMMRHLRGTHKVGEPKDDSDEKSDENSRSSTKEETQSDSIKQTGTVIQSESRSAECKVDEK